MAQAGPANAPPGLPAALIAVPNRPQAPAAQPAPKKNLPMVSARATRAVECLHRLPEDPVDLRASLQQDCHLQILENAGGTPAEQYATALIQHAIGYFKNVGADFADLKHDHDELTKRLDNIRKSIDTANQAYLDDDEPDLSAELKEDLLRAVSDEFPEARLKPFLVKEQIPQPAGQHRAAALPGGFIAPSRRRNEVVILEENGAYHAVVVNPNFMPAAIATPVERQHALRRDERLAHAYSAVEAVVANITGRKSLPVTDAVDNPREIELARLLRAPTGEIRKIDNPLLDGPNRQRMSYTTALLRHATGIHSRDDLTPIETEIITHEKDLHRREAEAFVAEAERMTAPGAEHEDTDPEELIIRMINERYQITLNVVTLTVPEAGQVSHVTRTPNNQNDDNLSGISVLLLKENDHYSPLIEVAPTTNPLLQTEERMNRKTTYGKMKAFGADLVSPARREARKMTNAELIASTTGRNPDKWDSREKAIRNELKKRQDTTRIDPGQKTFREAILNRFGKMADNDQQFSEMSLQALRDLLAEEAARSQLRKPVMKAIVRAIQQKHIEAHKVDEIIAPVPVPEPIVRAEVFRRIDIDLSEIIKNVTILETACKQNAHDVHFKAASEHVDRLLTMMQRYRLDLQTGAANGSRQLIQDVHTNFTELVEGFSARPRSQLYTKLRRIPSNGLFQRVTRDIRNLALKFDTLLRSEEEVLEDITHPFQLKKYQSYGLTAQEIANLQDIPKKMADLDAKKRGQGEMLQSILDGDPPFEQNFLDYVRDNRDVKTFVREAYRAKVILEKQLAVANANVETAKKKETDIGTAIGQIANRMAALANPNQQDTNTYTVADQVLYELDPNRVSVNQVTDIQILMEYSQRLAARVTETTQDAQTKKAQLIEKETEFNEFKDFFTELEKLRSMNVEIDGIERNINAARQILHIKKSRHEMDLMHAPQAI